MVRYRPGEVLLQAATPEPGYEVEVDDDGPQKVRVEFKGSGPEIQVEVEWEDDGLHVEIED